MVGEVRNHLLHDVALELITEKVDSNLLGHALVIEVDKLTLINNFDDLHGPGLGAGNIDLRENKLNQYSPILKHPWKNNQ